jgi:hypothetical protein
MVPPVTIFSKNYSTVPGKGPSWIAKPGILKKTIQWGMGGSGSLCISQEERAKGVDKNTGKSMDFMHPSVKNVMV